MDLRKLAAGLILPLSLLAVTCTAFAQQKAPVTLPTPAPGFAAAVAAVQNALVTGSCTSPQSAQMEVFRLENPSSGLPNLNDPTNFTGTSLQTTINSIQTAMSARSPCFSIFAAPGTAQIIVIGNETDRLMARQILQEIESGRRLMVLEARVYEVDDSVAQQLGIQYGNPILTENISEVAPNASPPPTGLALGGLIRTPLSVAVALNLLVSNGKAKVLADPNVTTLSGRPVQIHAGSDLNVLTYAPGAANNGSTPLVPTLQTFQLGVSLEMVPIINAAGDAVALTVKAEERHLTALINGAPEISTRDEITSVYLHNNEMLILGGLRLDNDNTTIQKVPVLGNIPVVGGLFRYKNVSNTHTELIILVRAHIVNIEKSDLHPCDYTRSIFTQPRSCAEEINTHLPPQMNGAPKN